MLNKYDDVWNSKRKPHPNVLVFPGICGGLDNCNPLQPICDAYDLWLVSPTIVARRRQWGGQWTVAHLLIVGSVICACACLCVSGPDQWSGAAGPVPAGHAVLDRLRLPRVQSRAQGPLPTRGVPKEVHVGRQQTQGYRSRMSVSRTLSLLRSCGGRCGESLTCVSLVGSLCCLRAQTRRTDQPLSLLACFT